MGHGHYSGNHPRFSKKQEERYDARMAHNKDLTASARLHYLENDETHHPAKMDYPAKLGIKTEDFRLIPGSTRIDYDQNKEMTNRKKHGYSLQSAVDLLQKVLLFNTDPFVTTNSFKI